MKKKHLKFLCDPITKADLVLEDAKYIGEEIDSGVLRSPDNCYVIRQGIPRFVNDEGYSDNFGYQWNRWSKIQFEDENIGKPMQGHTTRMFESITQFSAEKINGKTVLDVGCGPGRFTDVAASMGATVIALDYSSAIDAAKANFAGKDVDICFVQGDALQSPIKLDCVDNAFSIGVLHHTPSPEKGVQEVFGVLKNDGEFAIRVYAAKGFYTYPMVCFWRNIFIKLRPVCGHYPPLIYSYLFGTLGFILGKIWRPLSYPLRAIFPTAFLPDYQWMILETFDAISTSYQSGHVPSEIKQWLNNSGFKKIIHVKDNDFIGTKFVDSISQ